MFALRVNHKQKKVATHKGGVSWNTNKSTYNSHLAESPPIRVAWVEIDFTNQDSILEDVATHKGGVSWNMALGGTVNDEPGRHP